jgi:hypothetical protein
MFVRRTVAFWTAAALAAPSLAACGDDGAAPTPPPVTSAAADQQLPPDQQLLAMHLPELHFHGVSRIFPDDPARYVGDSTAVLYRGEPSGGDVIASGGGEPAPLALDFLGSTYASGEQASRDDTIAVDAARAQGIVTTPAASVVHGRVAAGSDGRVHLQFWLFFPFNDSLPDADGVIGTVGDHPADWELVQITLDGGRPVELKLSQHKEFETVPWHEVETADDAPGRPVVYVAWGTHALYPEPRDVDPLDFSLENPGRAVDRTDGSVVAARPELVVVEGEGGCDTSFRPSWAGWPGRWDTAGRIEAPCVRDHFRDPALTG